MYDYKQQCKEVLKYGVCRLNSKDYFAILQIIVFGNQAEDFLQDYEMQRCVGDFITVSHLVERASKDDKV